MASRVAVIIPCYNNADTVLDAVQSALSQDDVSVEVVVVDDGSTDGGIETLLPVSGSVRIVRQQNAGACVARNRGLAESSAPFVKFLDADDRLEPGCLAEQIARAERAGQDVIVFGRGRWETPEGEALQDYPRGAMAEGATLSAEALVEGSPLTSCPLHRRALLERVGGFNPDCPRGQEHDLHVRLGLAGAVFTFYDTLCYRYIQHPSANRISARQKRRDVCAAQFDVYDNQLRIAQESGRFDVPMRMAFARQFWRHGRVCARAGHDDLARRAFAQSDALAGGRARGAVGSRPYRVLAGLLGGMAIESVARVGVRA